MTRVLVILLLLVAAAEIVWTLLHVAPVLLWSAASLAWLAALCCGLPAPVAGLSAANGLLNITLPASLAYYGGDPAVRTAAYLQEVAERVIKWTVILLAGNAAAWATWHLSGSGWQSAAMFLAFGALAHGVQRSRPAIRLREYVGHAIEILHVERHAQQPGYRAGEIERMHTGERYAGLFGPVSTDAKANAAVRERIGRRLRQAELVARVMLVLIRPALRRFR